MGEDNNYHKILAFITSRTSKPRRLIETRHLLETRRLLEHWPRAPCVYWSLLFQCSFMSIFLFMC